jgi:hypothetical protein
MHAMLRFDLRAAFSCSELERSTCSTPMFLGCVEYYQALSNR